MLTSGGCARGLRRLWLLMGLVSRRRERRDGALAHEGAAHGLDLLDTRLYLREILVKPLRHLLRLRGAVEAEDGGKKSDWRRRPQQEHEDEDYRIVNIDARNGLPSAQQQYTL